MSSKEPIESAEAIEVDGLEAWESAGEKLRALDPVRFLKVLSLARTYVAIYERPNESEEVYLSRLAQIAPTSKASA